MAKHALPQELILKRDKLFTFRFWRALTAKLKVKYKLSTAYYPQTDGQTKRIN